jgi:hypothetical protein
MTRYNPVTVARISSYDFQQAVADAEIMVGTPIWDELSEEEQTTLIYLRMRQIEGDYGMQDSSAVLH